jgi:hypothetical protein
MQAPLIEDHLALERCPQCSVHKPNLTRHKMLETKPGPTATAWWWGIYVCQHCQKPVVAGGPVLNRERAFATVIIPEPSEVDKAVPDPARRYLQQAREALHTPDGATMLAASGVDALLKAKGYAKGTLNERINQAATDHVITKDMAAWAHHVRLDANDPRHADVARPHATKGEAEQTLEFALALAQFLFVLPARVARGMRAAGGPQQTREGHVERSRAAL